MELDELLWVLNDSAVVEIFINTELVACYDEKDSIPEEYNHYRVFDIYASENKICIEIGKEIPE